MQNSHTCSGPASRLPSLAPALPVEAVACAVAPEALLQAEHQAAVALAGELGAPRALSCGQREAQGQPRLVGLGGGGCGDTPFSRVLLTAEGTASVPAIAVALHLGIAVVAQEVVVAGIMQLAASAWELEALGVGVFFPQFSPLTPKFETVQGCVRAWRFLSGSLPVRGILGLPFAPKAAVATVGGVIQQGVFPRRLCNHLLQLPEAPVSWGQAWGGGNSGAHADAQLPSSIPIPLAPKLVPDW